MLLFRPPQRKLLPIGRPQIDWSHPLTSGLIGCWLPGISRGLNLAGIGPDLTLGSAFNTDVTSEGPANRSVAANNNLFVTADQAFKSWSALSMYWRGTLFGSPLGGAQTDMVGISYSNSVSSPYYVANLTVLSNRTIQLVWNTAGSFVGGTTSASLSGLTASNDVVGLGATFKVGGNAVCYYRGVQLLSNSFGAGAPTSTANSRLAIGTYGGDPGLRSINGQNNIALVWNRDLSAAEMALLDADPYCFLFSAEGELPALWTTAPKALSAAAGAYAVTGAATTTVVLKRRLTANATSYALTGQPALIKYFWHFPAAVGSYLISGQPATLRRAAVLTAEPAFYAVTGASAGITASQPITLLYLDAGTASYTLSGGVARLFTGEPVLSERTVAVKGEDRTVETLVESRAVAALAETRLVRVATETQHV